MPLAVHELVHCRTRSVQPLFRIRAQTPVCTLLDREVYPMPMVQLAFRVAVSGYTLEFISCQGEVVYSAEVSPGWAPSVVVGDLTLAGGVDFVRSDVTLGTLNVFLEPVSSTRLGHRHTGSVPQTP